MRQRLVRMGLLIAGFFFLSGGCVLGDARPVMGFAAVFALFPALLGTRRQRLIGLVLVVVSLVLGEGSHRRHEQRFDRARSRRDGIPHQGGGATRVPVAEDPEASR